MEVLPDDGLATQIEARAAEMARRAGEILQERFGRPLEVEYKDKKRQDPVTSADKECQAYLVDAISHHFPDHGIVGEEGSDAAADAAATDFLWIIDPLDGTTNFLNGLPIYAVSIAVLHQGTPLVGALFIPWPGKIGGVVLHARRGGGAWMDGEPLSIPHSEGPEANRLTGLPASFGAGFRLGKGLRGKVGEVRVTGSIAYELALTACGAFQYAVFGAPRIWDVAGGVVIVMEAGGMVLIRQRKGRRWEPATTLGPTWERKPPSFKDIRNWATPVIAGNAQVAPLVAANIRSRLFLLARIARMLRRLGHKRS